MDRIQVNNFGPIGHVDVSLGDLTIIVGAQASGKSLFLELMKLVIDKNAIISNLKKFNYIIKNDIDSFLDLYFGMGVSKAWGQDTSVIVDNRPAMSKIPISKLPPQPEEEQVFYIPAQRILSVSDGRPKNFMEFDPSSPYVLRQFSDTVRVFMAGGFGGNNNVIFPINTRLKKSQRDLFNSTIFHDGKVLMDTSSGQRKMKLSVADMEMPFMTWSAGQKEFLPLLMGFYCVSGPPTQVINKEQYKYIVIEEPEMGLHPQAIKAVLLQILELIQAGYKVIISTHSPVPLEFVWAFNSIRESMTDNKEEVLMRLFGGEKLNASAFKGIFSKDIKTYCFSRKEGKVNSVNISTLDPMDDDSDIREWGGMSSFSSEASEIVSQLYE